MLYGMRFNAPKLSPAGGLERGGTAYVFGVKDVVNQLNMFRAIFAHPQERKTVFYSVV